MLVSLARRTLFVLIMTACLCAPIFAAVDVTTLGVIPDDGLNDSPTIAAAFQQHEQLYFPEGVYHLSSTVYIPSNRYIHGAGMDNTTFEMKVNTVAFRIEGQTNICMSDFSIDRPLSLPVSRDELIFVMPSPVSSDLSFKRIRFLNNRSRAPALSVYNAVNTSILACEAIDNQRQYPEGANTTVYGSGITMHTCQGGSIEYCKVTETRDMVMTDNPYFNYYQASAIQVAGCADIRVIGNYVYYSGQGIDTSGSTDLLIQGNVIDNCHSVGIKLVNGSSRIDVLNNWIGRCGLVGVWLAPGSQDLSCVNCLVDGNTISKIGQGIGLDFWDVQHQIMVDSMPSGIHFDNANSYAGRSHHDTVSNNTFYENEQMLYDVIVRESDLKAYSITIVDNQRMPGLAPPQPELQAPGYAPCIADSGAGLWEIYD